MKCARFEYLRPAGVEEAVQALDATEDAKILAGGQSLVPVLALRMARPSVLVDVNRIPGLSGIRRTEDVVEVGALARHRALADQTVHPLLAAAARCIGHPAIRTRGTVGGSLAHADPAAELPVVAVATDAVVTVAGPGGLRAVAVDDLFVGALHTTLAENEMIVSVRFRLPRRWGFTEFARRHGDFALVTAAVAELDGRTRITLGGVTGRPVRALRAEAVLAQGGTARDAALTAGEEFEPTADLHGSAPFRRALAAEMTRRALVDSGIM